jgi:hypothetical protein
MNSSLCSFYTQEDLWQILGLPVSDSPLVCFWLKGGCFLVAIAAVTVTAIAVTVSSVSCWCFLDLFGSVCELFILNITTLFSTLLFIAELKTNNSLNFSNMLFNGHEFIHQSQLKSVTVIQELWRVA